MLSTMNINTETYNLVVLLGPGFIAWAIFRALVRDEVTINLKILFEVIAFSSAINFFIEMLKTENAWANNAIQLVIIIIIPIFVSILILKGYHRRWLKNIKIFKTYRKDAWLDVFSEEVRYVRVFLNDGRIVTGFPNYYTESNDGDKYLYIYHHEWMKGSNIVESKMHGILLKEDKIRFIEFYLKNGEKYSDCTPRNQENENG